MAVLLGKKIREARKKQNLSLEKLAEQIDSSKSYVWELENKEGVNPTADKLSKLSTALKVSVEYLIDDEQEEATDSAFSKAFYRRYEKLTPEKQKALDAVLSALENESKK